MKRLLVGCAAIAVAFCSHASAADLTSIYKAPPAPAAAAYNWSGLYGGVNAGYSFGHSSLDGSTFGTANSTTWNADSFIGGGQVGYNFQSGSLVYGLEADIAWRNATAAASFLNPNGLDRSTFNDQQGWIGTLRPRVGVAANNWLFYGTGGLAFGSSSTTIPRRVLQWAAPREPFPIRIRALAGPPAAASNTAVIDGRSGSNISILTSASPR